MWEAIWKRIQPRRAGRSRAGKGREPADMGIDIALEATLEPALPPLFDVSAVGRTDRTAAFGTDRRSFRSAAG